MPKCILLSDAVDELTKVVLKKYYRSILKKSIRDRYKTAAIKNGWVHTNKYHFKGKIEVNSDEIYPWFNDIFKPLGKNSTKLIKWKICIGYLHSQYSIFVYKRIPDYFANDKKAIALLHKLEDELDAEKDVEIAGLKKKWGAEKFELQKENDRLRNRVKELEEKEKIGSDNL